MTLHDLPLEERPRERLMQQGVEALSLQELLAILLVTGTKGKTVLELAHELLHRFGSLEALLEASLEELIDIKGIGEAKAIQLKAAFGIALKRPAIASLRHQQITSQEAYALVKGELSRQTQEMLMVVLKDVRGKLIACERVSLGTLSEVLIHPREIFYPAVRRKASSLILAHNHPSGDPTPSAADLEIARLLLRSSKVMGINLDDHLIIGKQSFISLRAVGLLV